jgi:hypothetical protein
MDVWEEFPNRFEIEYNRLSYYVVDIYRKFVKRKRK